MCRWDWKWQNCMEWQIRVCQGQKHFTASIKLIFSSYKIHVTLWVFYLKTWSYVGLIKLNLGVRNISENWQCSNVLLLLHPELLEDRIQLFSRICFSSPESIQNVESSSRSSWSLSVSSLILALNYIDDK